MARRIAASAVEAVMRRELRLDEALDGDKRLPGLEARDRAFVLALARCTIRHLGQILAMLDAHLTRGWPPRCGQLQPFLVTAAAQILFMETPAHAAVDQAIRLVREDRDAMHFAALANAVLRAIGRDPTVKAPAEANLPHWLAGRWQRHYGTDITNAMARGHLNEPPLDVSAKAKPELWAERLGGQLLPTGTIRLTTHAGAVTDLPGFAEGEWWVQDAAALLPVLMAGDVKRKTVLDLCAAPGGKTAAFAARGAKVTAVDRDPQRLARLMQNMDRLRLKVEPIVRDMMHTELGGPYDVVLLDAPCSSTGTLRRHPDVAWLKKETDIFSLAKTQAALLERAATFVSEGGLLIYATCSLEPEEGENQIISFLQRHDDFTVEPAPDKYRIALGDMVTAEGFLRSRPDMLAEQGGLDGFFVARLRKHDRGVSPGL